MRLMRKTAVLAAFLLACPAAAAPIIYTGSHVAGGYTANLSIETDGTIGEINAANIVDFSIEFSDGSSTFLLTRDGNSFALTAPLIASESSLVLPYFVLTPEDSNHEFFAASNAPRYGYMFGVGAGSILNGGNYQLRIDFNYGSATMAISDDYVLGTAGIAPVPEPASWAMMIGGFAIMGGAMRRRTVRTAIRFAH